MPLILKPIRRTIRADFPGLDTEYFWFRADSGVWNGPFQTLRELRCRHPKSKIVSNASTDA